MPKPRVPHHLKILRGERRPSRLGPRTPSRSLGVGAERPDWLSPEATAVWDRLAPQLTEARILSELDGLALATLCVMQAAFIRWAKQGKESVRIAGELRALYKLFGMTPLDRDRVTPLPEPEAPDPFAAFDGGGKLAKFRSRPRPRVEE